MHADEPEIASGELKWRVHVIMRGMDNLRRWLVSIGIFKTHRHMLDVCPVQRFVHEVGESSADSAGVDRGRYYQRADGEAMGFLE